MYISLKSFAKSEVVILKRCRKLLQWIQLLDRSMKLLVSFFCKTMLKFYILHKFGSCRIFYYYKELRENRNNNTICVSVLNSFLRSERGLPKNDDRSCFVTSSFYGSIDTASCVVLQNHVWLRKIFFFYAKATNSILFLYCLEPFK